MAKASEKTPSKIAFGDRLHAAIMASGYESDAAFAKRVRISNKRLGNYIAGWRWPDPELLADMCEILECTSDWLYWGKRAGLLGEFRDRIDAYYEEQSRSAGK